MAARRGRPPKSDGKTLVVCARLSPTDVKLLRSIMAEEQATAPYAHVSLTSAITGLIRAEALRRGITP